jgi:peptidoglycan/LPS O-acetylase OafA/YrhL
MSAIDFRTHYRPLDGLRGIAILAVFGYHYAGGLVSRADTVGLKALGVVFGLGWSGVDLFFVLSGFLITGILFDTQNDAHYFKNFYARRALRIVPVYYFGLFVLLLFARWTQFHWGPPRALLFLYLTYPGTLLWPALVHISPVIQISHTWSLCVEEQFYLIWPWVIVRLRTPNRILSACGVAILAALALRVGIQVAGVSERLWCYTFLFCRMDELAFGAAIAVAMRGPWQAWLRRAAPLGLVAGTLAISTMCWWRHSLDHSDAVIGTVGYTILGILFGSVLILCLQPGSWVSRLSSTDFLRVFGKYSYGFYLYHFPLLSVLGPMRTFFVARTHSYALGGVIHLSLCLLVNLLVAVASFHWIESPILRWKDRFQYGGAGERASASTRGQIQNAVAE